jgi:nucleoid DNA-binding protein
MKEKIKVTKETLIKDIAKQTNKNISDVRDVYNALEKTIFDILSSVDVNGDITIRLFEGISLDGTYIPEKTKQNNLTGEVSFVNSKIKPKFNITRSYCEKLNLK